MRSLPVVVECIWYMQLTVVCYILLSHLLPDDAQEERKRVARQKKLRQVAKKTYVPMISQLAAKLIEGSGACAEEMCSKLLECVDDDDKQNDPNAWQNPVTAFKQRCESRRRNANEVYSLSLSVSLCLSLSLSLLSLGLPLSVFVSLSLSPLSVHVTLCLYLFLSLSLIGLFLSSISLHLCLSPVFIDDSRFLCHTHIYQHKQMHACIYIDIHIFIYYASTYT